MAQWAEPRLELLTPMKLLTFASAWCFGSLDRCYAEVEQGYFDGVEGPPPAGAELRARGARAPFIAEICTGGDYAPASSVESERHLDDFERQLEAAAECGAARASCLFGSDAWSFSQAVDGYGRALELAARSQVPVSFETHRGRPTFHPRLTLDLLQALPELTLTCDLSHWCVVSERLVDQPHVIEAVAQRARHLHARVGYAQGPQVPDPRVANYQNALAAHEGWWAAFWRAAHARGEAVFSATPEFGPDGYLHVHPVSGEPVADLTELNRWMSQRLRQRFADLCGG